nr:hypothetical protein [Salinispora pacifica]
MGLSAGRGGVATAATSPENPQLCKGRRVTLRYEVAFAVDTVDGQLTVVGEAVSTDGRVVGRDSDAAKVTGGSLAVAPTSSAAPAPTVAATEAATAAASTAVAAVADPGVTRTARHPARSSGGSGFRYAGLAMVAVARGATAPTPTARRRCRVGRPIRALRRCRVDRAPRRCRVGPPPRRCPRFPASAGRPRRRRTTVPGSSRAAGLSWVLPALRLGRSDRPRSDTLRPLTTASARSGAR